MYTPLLISEGNFLNVDERFVSNIVGLNKPSAINDSSYVLVEPVCFFYFFT